MTGWQNFYVIVGAAGATLIGVQFVVITLVATIGHPDTSAESVSAFGTPTVVHFAGALVISAIMCAPWPSLAGAAVTISLCGIAALIYTAIVIRRARRQTNYIPEAEDWLWHAILPCCDYAALTLAGFLLCAIPAVAAFIVAAAALGLLLIGVHNSWDAVTYMVTSRKKH